MLMSASCRRRSSENITKKQKGQSKSDHTSMRTRLRLGGCGRPSTRWERPSRRRQLIRFGKSFLRCRSFYELGRLALVPGIIVQRELDAVGDRRVVPEPEDGKPTGVGVVQPLLAEQV